MTVKICYIISDINKALAFEWIAEFLDKEKFELHFILLNPEGSILESFLRERKILFERITYKGKKSLPGAIFKIYKYLNSHKIQVVHCHLFEANIAGLIAAKIAKVKKRIYTRHYSTYHHDYFPKAVNYDKFINWLATDIVAISENVRNVLIQKENVNKNKIHLIHHGFDLERFSKPEIQKIENLKTKYFTAGKFPVIGVISRYFSLKGIQFIIPAFIKLLEDYPGAYLILANANGNYKSEIKNLLSQLPTKSYLEIPFEEDIFSLYHLFDIFIHVPINKEIEAFGQTYVEALAAGVPSIFTLSGVASEFIKNGENALVVDYQNSDEIYEALKRLLRGNNLRSKIIKNGITSVNQFQVKIMIKNLETLYKNNT